jgi:hypothetical protein
MRRLPFSLLFFLVIGAGGVVPALAAVSYLDLSKAANMGPAQSFDEAVPGGGDLKEKEGLANIPQGPQTLRGIPFLLLDSSANQGKSFIVLKGKRKGSFPEAVALSAGNLKAGYLFFLHSCKWGGTASNVTVAEYDIVYSDGGVEVIPLKVGEELTNFTGSDDTPASYLAWWHKYKNTDMGVNLFPWKNPRPDVPIQTILFKSLNKMPVPLLFAVTASDTELPISTVSPKPEKTFQTDTQGWLPFTPSDVSPTGTAIDMSFLLDAPAGKHGGLKAEGERLAFADGTKARFWGIQLSGEWWNLTNEQLAQTAGRLAVYGCNLVAVDTGASTAIMGRLEDLTAALKPKGIYLDLTGWDQVQLQPALTSDPAVFTQGLWTRGNASFADAPSTPTSSQEFQDVPMVLQPEASIPWSLILGRHLGTPYRAQWGDKWPNEYIGESPLLLSVYGAFEDWPACLGMGMGGADWGSALASDQDLSNLPQLLVQWPTAALAFLRGDIKQGRFYDLKSQEPKQDIKACLTALAHCSGVNESDPQFKTDTAGTLKVKVQDKLKSFVSDTSQIRWQGNIGLFQLSSPRFQAVVGFLGHQKLTSPVWQVESPNFFASLSLISLTKTNLWASDHMLLTGVTRMENTGQVYNAAKTKLIFSGKGPILVEPLQAKITLFRYKAEPKLGVRALDANGQILKEKIHVKWVKNNLVFSWVPEASYVEIYKTHK